MSQPIERTNSLQPSLEYGTLQFGMDKDQFAVILPYGQVTAQQSASCLLTPMEGDFVLVSVDLEGACYILSVLERTLENSPSTISVPGDCVIESGSGSVELRAASNLVLSAADEIEVTGGKISMHADIAELCISKISVLGRVLHAQFKRITTMATSIEQSMKRLTQRMESTERFVAEHEEIQTGSTRYLVEETLTTHAGNTLNISEDLHTMHAEQIHMS